MANIDAKKMLEDNSIFDLSDWRHYFKKMGTVLLVVDPQNDVLDEKGNLGFWQVWKHARENGSIENIKRIIASCRAKGIPVIWAEQYRAAGGRDVFPGTYDGDSLSLIRTILPEAFLGGTWETEILPELAECMDEKDIVIGKHGSSMFEGVNLEKHLKTIGAGSIIITGFLTDFCVEATARSACDRGCLPITVSDGCAAQGAETHDPALERLSKSIGPVIDTEGLLSLLDEKGVGAAPAAPRTFDIEEIGAKMAEGLSLNDIVEWKRYFKKESTALMVIDAQNYNLHEKGGFSFSGLWKQASDNGASGNVKRLVQTCHEAGIRVFWTRHNRPAGGKDLFPGTLDARMMETIHEVIPKAHMGGTRDAEIHDELIHLVRADDIVVDKPGWSALEGTSLERYFNHLGINTIIACGFSTDLSVESTARSASDRGYMTVIAKDACAAANQKDHDAALERFDRLIGPVTTTDDIMEILNK